MEAARELERRLRDVVLGGTRTVIVDLTDLTELSSGLIRRLDPHPAQPQLAKRPAAARMRVGGHPT